MDEAPWEEGAHVVWSDGTAYKDGSGDYGHHPKFEEGGTVTITFADDGASFSWNIDGQKMKDVKNIPADENRVLCVGSGGSDQSVTLQIISNLLPGAAEGTYSDRNQTEANGSVGDNSEHESAKKEAAALLVAGECAATD
jgi:hypothetical protein